MKDMMKCGPILKWLEMLSQTDAMIIDVWLAAVLCILQLVQLRKVCNNTFARYVCDV